MGAILPVPEIGYRSRVRIHAALPFLVSGLAVAQPAPQMPGPPIDLRSPTPHRITMTVDTAPARDFLTLITGGKEPGAALRRFKASPVVTAALLHNGLVPDDTFGRLASAAAGTPDALLASYAARAAELRAVLDVFEQEGSPASLVAARRIAALLPPEPALVTPITLVPSIGLGGFADVEVVRDGDALILVADLPRLLGDQATAIPREVLLKAIRSGASEAWRTLFDTRFRKPPAWSAEKGPDVDALLARVVEEGPAMMFLVPDDFFPIAALFDEPIGRGFSQLDLAIQRLADPKRKEAEKREVLAIATRGELWNRYAAAAGVGITDVLLRHAGREEYVKALGAGPRAVLSLYQLVAKSKKVPELGKSVRKALEAGMKAP